jgi:glutaredoxin 3
MDVHPPDHSPQPQKIQPRQPLPNPGAGTGRLPRINRVGSDGLGQRLAKVEIYTRRFCADSMRTKGIFDRKNIQYNEYLIDDDLVNSSAMSQRTEGLEATPQVFIDGTLIGGLRQVMELEQTGDLNFLLGISA